MNRSLKSIMLLFLSIIIGFFILFAALIYFGQHKLLYHPSKTIAMKPSDVGLISTDVKIPVTDSENIHAWFFHIDSTAPTIIFSHGNAGNISHRLETVSAFLSLSTNVLLYDYRGYGLSDGSVNEENSYEDALACYNWIKKQENIDIEQVYLFGRSLGAAVAIDLATRVNLQGLIIESSFTSVAEIGKKLYPFLPVRYLVRYEYDSISKIGKANCPVLVMHSPHDELIPYEMGLKLFEAANEPKKFFELSGGHNDLDFLYSGAYKATLSEFLGLNRDK